MFDVGLIVAFAGIAVASMAGILGVWMERDRERKPYFAILFSLVIVFASFMELGRAVFVAYQDAKTKDSLATVLVQLSEIAANSDNPELADFVGAELSRSDPKMLKRVQKKVAAKGGDPSAIKKRAAEGRRSAGASSVDRARPAGDPTALEEGKDGKEGKAEKDGKAIEDAAEAVTEGKAGKALDEVTEGKAGKAVEGAKDAVHEAGKAAKAAEGTADKATKAAEGAANAIGGALGTGKAGKKAP